MFNLSKQVRGALFFLAMGLVPVTIDSCNNSGGSTGKDQFEVVAAINIVMLLVAAARKPKAKTTTALMTAT